MPDNAAFDDRCRAPVDPYSRTLPGGPMRIPHRATWSALVVGWVGAHAAGCTSSSMSDTPHVDFISDTYTLQPGEEKYFCYATNLPADRDIAIVRLEPTYGAGTHHILVSQTL